VKLNSIASILLALVLWAPLLAQEHAPLFATCEADLALWYHAEEFTQYLNAQTAFFTDKTPNKTALNFLPIDEVIARHLEMGQCWTMTHRDIYHEADASYMGIFSDREHDFIIRHNLMSQLRAEDAEGKR
jgi:hypothetical protein